jgi:cytochrome d ubiquinol oxidase subunit I
MRVMAYLGSLLPLLVLWGLWLWRRRRLETSRAFLVVASWAVITPFVMNTAGWMLTENGRQPWIVQGLQLTADASSPSVSTAEIWLSLGTFVALFIAVGITWTVLMVRFGRRGLADDDLPDVPDPERGDGPRSPALTY